MPSRRPRPTRPAPWVRAARRLTRGLAARARRGAGHHHDEGFTLLEMIISIVIVTIVMAALTTVYVTTLSSMSSLRMDQAATRIATDAIDQARSVGATEAIAGRGSATVAAQFAAAPASVQPWLDAMDPAIDAQASSTAGADAALPTQPTTEVLDNVTFSVGYYVGLCYRLRALGASDDPCVAAAAKVSPGDYVTYARVVVAVTWSGQRCTGAACSHVSAVLLNGDPDPVFNLNTEPPPAPKLTGCAAQKSAAGDVFDATNPPGQPGAFFLEAAPTTTGEIALCTLTDGVPPFTFALGDSAGHPLPQGLTISATGIITGTITGDPATYAGITITVTDAFLRQSTSNAFDWTVVGPLVIGPVADHVSVVGTPIAPLTLTATGGFGAPYTWSAAGLPDGVTLDPTTGTLSGTPLTAGVSPVTVTVQDSDTTRARKASLDLTWTVYDPLVIAAADQANSLGDAVNLPIDITGGSGDYTLTATGLPSGLALAGDSSSGYRVTGTIATGGVYDVILTATDAVPAVPPAEADVVWVVADGGPLVANPGDQTSRAGDDVVLPIAGACGPNPPCTWSVSGSVPNGLAFNAGSGTFSGAATAPGTYTGITVTYTDSATDKDGNPTPQSASATFSWTVTPPASMSIGNQRTAVTKVATAATPTVNGGKPGAVYTFTAATALSGGAGVVAGGLPQGLTIDPATGTISGTPTSAGIYTVTLTATSPTDAPLTADFTWYVLGFQVPDQVCYTSSSSPKCSGNKSWSWTISDLSAFVTGASSAKSFSGQTISDSSATATLGGTANRTLTLTASSKSIWTVTVTVTDTGGNAPSASVTDDFTWQVK